MRHLSLFTGSGIGDYAAEQCGIETVAQCEIDDCCRFCLSKMFPGAVQFKDVKDVSATELDRLGLLPIDIISGGFPCTDISCAGKGAGIHGKQSGLWFEMRRVIGEVRPRFVLVENVPALRSRGGDRVLSDLEEEGYAAEACVVGAWAVGAPHKRDRVWIVARAMAKSASDGYTPATRQRKVAKVEQRTRRQEESEGIEQFEGIGDGSDVYELAWIDGLGDPSKLADGPRQCGEQRAERNGVGVRGGEAMADAEQDGWGTGAGKQENETGQGERRGELAGSVQLPNSESIGRQAEGVGGVGGPRPRFDVPRWPSHPGEPQHDWEAPRLAQFSVGDAAHGLAGRLRSRTNKALLRMAGNGWCYPNAILIYQWIADNQTTNEASEL